MIGAFASSNQNSYGIGKIVDINKEIATIEYFVSISKRVEKRVSRKSVTPEWPQDQTRCYVWSEETQSWRAGRVGKRDVSDRTYEVTFPNKQARYIPEKKLYVRCKTPVEDPTETLALRGHETPFFHDRRRAFVNCLTAQRAKSHGMTGLLSSNIQLYPHQTEVIRRVLEDPVQRYLLADEVGLGKTIEAGVILRQYMLDEPVKSAIVIVPDTLVDQWEVELEEKFNLSDFGPRLTVISTESMSDETIANTDNLGFLIIDEAHHLAAGANEPETSIKWQKYQVCKKLAHSAERLLLLSATPVLHNENNFLAMLHLLDPETYRLEDLDAFRERVDKRQDIGRILLSFGENSAPFVVKTTLNRLLSVFPNDTRLNLIVTTLKSLLESDTSDQSEQKYLIRSIRTHISDTYRLHRRMLRNRRESVKLAPRLDAENSASDLKEEYDDDDRGLNIHDLVDDWRGYALQFMSGLGDGDEQHDLLKSQFRHVFKILLRASGSWLGILERVLLARLSGDTDSIAGGDFDEEECKVIVETPLFPGEHQLLERMLQIVRLPSRGADRVQLLGAMLHRIKSAGTKAVVFTSFESAQEELIRNLRAVFGNGSVASHDSRRTRGDVDDDRKRFQETRGCFVLVSDSSGEEGLNLQFADWIIHFDLPWSPNRLEQRIGRLDRIGRNRSVKTRTLMGPESENTLYYAWYKMLKDGLGIFQKSIAGLQFYIDTKLPLLEATLFDDGAAGLIHIIPQILNEIESEELKINEQNALDEIDTLERNAAQYFEGLQKYDEQHELIQKAYDDWVTEVLRFNRSFDESFNDIFKYRATEYTLLPRDVLADQFKTVTGVPGTYNRATAVRHPGNRLFRLGEPFTKALARQVRFDDRGQSFMIWRHLKDWDPDESSDWAGFRFNYIVEANLKGAKQILVKNNLSGVGLKALSRRADAMFPPFTYTNFLDLRLQEVVDDQLLNILPLRYLKEGPTRCDYNINFERSPAINHLVDPQQWGDICNSARARSEELLRTSHQFQQICKSYALITKREMIKRVDQLRFRCERDVNSGVDNRLVLQELALEEELQTALIRGVMKPTTRLDSVGFIVISGRPPID